MDKTNIEAMLAKADELLGKELPSGRQGERAYSGIARSAFEKISKARADGYSFVQICAVFAQAGLLPAKARPHSFRHAFYRETERRKRAEQLLKQTTSNTKTTLAKNELSMPKTAANTISAETEEERIKRLTRGMVKAGDGKLSKILTAASSSRLDNASIPSIHCMSR